MNIAINGFGRIGRATFKALLNKNSSKFKIVAINDLTDPKTLAHLLKYDSSYGIYGKQVKALDKALVVGNKKFKILAERNPQHLPWKGLEVDIVLECTGIFRTKKDAGLHIKAGAKKVIISAPGKSDNIKTIVLGVNEKRISKKDKIISNASCTTNCLAPVSSVIKENFGIRKAIMTTIHSYTADQNIVDGPHHDLRRARAAAVNIVPTTTGAAKATCKTIPGLKNKFDGLAVRVPTPVVSLVDAVYLTRKKIDVKKVNLAFKKAARSARLKNILGVTMEPLVSSDLVANPLSTIVDLNLTRVVDGNLVKVIAWYDNEWGYSSRMADMVEFLIRKKLVS